jgi:hypothetical protein
MNHLTSTVPVFLVLGALSAATAAADVAPPAAAAAQATSVTPVVTAPKAMPVTATSVAAKAASSRSEPTVRKLVCLNMSLQCFALKAQPDSSAKTPGLDLRAPDIRRIVPEVQLREPLNEPEEIYEQEQVQVEGTRPEIDVPIGLASLGWAAMHPLQSWRIFLPVPPGSAK